MNQVLRPKTHAEWLELRKSGIGSSEIATIVGLNPFDTPRELWMRKLGIKPPVEENNAMRLGHYLEDAVAQMWSEHTGLQVIKRSAGDWIIRDKEHPYLQVSPDRTFWVDPSGKHNLANKGILECKTTSRAVDPDDIPKHWFCQIQYQLGVAGLTHGYIAWLTGGRDFGMKEIKFVPSFYEYLVAEAEKFYNINIMGKVEPLPINAADVADKYPVHEDGVILEANDDIYTAYLKLKDVRKQIDVLAEQKDALEDRLKMACMHAEGIASGGITLATWKSGKPVTKVDTKAMVADNPELAKKYTKTTTSSRRFLLK